MANAEQNVTKAVKAEAPIVGAPAEYLDGGVRQVTYPLDFPFRLDGAEYRSVTANKLTGKEIFAVSRESKEKPHLDRQILVFAVMCKVPYRVIEAMDASDIQGLSEASAVFTRQLDETADAPTGNDGENTSQK